MANERVNCCKKEVRYICSAIKIEDCKFKETKGPYTCKHLYSYGFSGYIFCGCKEAIDEVENEDIYR